MEIDVSKHRALYQYSKLSQYPEYQEETIATHYLSLAATAQQLYHLIKHRHYSGDSKEVNEVISMLTTQIQDSHYEAFGIKLEWPKNFDTNGDSLNTAK